jgi:hypothetical protein
MVRKRFLKFPLDELVCNFIFTANFPPCGVMRFLVHYSHKLHNEELHNLKTTLARHYWGYTCKTKTNEMVGECNMHGKDEKCTQNFSRKKLKGRDHFEDLGIYDV